MEDRTLAIPVAFILLAALLCWMLIGAKGKWWLKLLTILIVPSFGLAVWASISSYKGWPTTDEPPEKALLVWGVVHEPDPRTGNPGVIYLWLTPIREDSGGTLNPLGYESRNGEPRAYRLPYSRQLHDALTGAQAAAKEGRPMMFGKGKRGRRSDGSRREEDGEPVEGEGDARPGGVGGARGDGEREQYQFYDLPPAAPFKPSEQ